MAKQYQLFFEPEATEKIEKIAVEAGFRSGRQWMIEQVYKAIKKYEEAAKAFDQPEFVFLMKDGSCKRSCGVNAGGAWRALGFSTEEASEKMEAYKTLADAREAGWPVDSPEMAKIPAPPAQEQEVAADDLPFGS